MQCPSCDAPFRPGQAICRCGWRSPDFHHPKAASTKQVKKQFVMGLCLTCGGKSDKWHGSPDDPRCYCLLHAPEFLLSDVDKMLIKNLRSTLMQQAMHREKVGNG